MNSILVILVVIGVFVAPLPRVDGYHKCKWKMHNAGGGCIKDLCPVITTAGPAAPNCGPICSSDLGVCSCHCCNVGNCTSFDALIPNTRCSVMSTDSECSKNCASLGAANAYICQEWGRDYCFCSNA